MTYAIASVQPELRDPQVAWDVRAPGLYPGEALVELGDHLAAVSVETEWLANGAGVVLKGCARWCDADGQTHLCPDGKHVETETRHTADPLSIKTHGLPALKKEMLLLMLGEPAALVHGLEDEVPVLGLSEEHRLNASIGHAIDCVQAVEAEDNAIDIFTTTSQAKPPEK